MSFFFAFGVGITAAAYLESGGLLGVVPHTLTSMVGFVYPAWYAVEVLTMDEAAALENYYLESYRS